MEYNEVLVRVNIFSIFCVKLIFFIEKIVKELCIIIKLKVLIIWDISIKIWRVL